jgi:hypothetical protein
MGYVIQPKTSITPSAIWSNLVGAPLKNGGKNYVTNGASGNRFYRLAK